MLVMAKEDGGLNCKRRNKMGHWTTIIIGDTQEDDINHCVGREIDYFKVHTGQVLFPNEDIGTEVQDLGSARYMGLNPCDCMKKCQIDIDKTREGDYWPPQIIINGGEFFRDINFPDWESELERQWDLIDDDEVITIVDTHT
jgi:hypothetical protein